jgi:serine/threonine-protein kinase
MSKPTPTADRNLIFGLLALQMDFVSREQLLEAMTAWMLVKDTPLGEILCRRGVLGERRSSLLEGLVEEHLAQHGSDPQASLAALRVEPEVWQQLERLDDSEVQASLGSLAPTQPAPPAAPAATTQARLRYRPLREYARMGLGDVFVALDEELQREVSLRQMRERFADHPEARAQFLREAEITGQLEHPGVVPVHGLGCYPDGRPFYATRLVRGETMHHAIDRFHQADEQAHRNPGERRLALRELLGRFVAVCCTVAYAHSRGVIHRDLKPDNVLLGEYGETLVVEWGLSWVDSGSGPAQAATNQVGPELAGFVVAVGTPGFMAPEQALGHRDQRGPSSDVFSLGATLYYLLTGHAPYQGPDALAQAQRGEVVPAQQRKRSVPAALEAVCQRAMAQRPADRYQTVRALAEDVQRWLADEPVSAYREPLAERARRWGRRHQTLVSVGVTVLLASVLGLGGGLWLVNHDKARIVTLLDRAVEAEEKERQQRALAETLLKRALKAEREAEANRKQAQANLKLAKQAVDECFNVAKEHPLFQQPGMEKARKLLLEKTQPFYQHFRMQRPVDLGISQEEGKE